MGRRLRPCRCNGTNEKRLQCICFQAKTDAMTRPQSGKRSGSDPITLDQNRMDSIMKKYLIAMACVAAGLMGVQSASAQCADGSCSVGGIGGDGMTQPVCGCRPNGLRDRFSPRPEYTYSPAGHRAGWEHSWNQNRAAVTSWHGCNSYWRFGTPTALVVPPTAAFQSSYGWGVGQVRSLPINHQFQKAGGYGMGNGAGNFAPTPYWPSNTEQFGVYPVRGPWH